MEILITFKCTFFGHPFFIQISCHRFWDFEDYKLAQIWRCFFFHYEKQFQIKNQRSTRINTLMLIFENRVVVICNKTRKKLWNFCRTKFFNDCHFIGNESSLADIKKDIYRKLFCVPGLIHCGSAIIAF